MNRDIRFRVWDPRHSCYRYWGFLDDGIFTGIPTGGQLSIDHCKWNSEQYTGLKDKNGKDVYEGDIVRCSRGCPHEVIFSHDIGGTFGGGMPGWYLSGVKSGFGEGYAWTGTEEVIGNFNEIPELIEALRQKN